MTDTHATEIVRAPSAAMATPADRTLHPLIAQLAAGHIDPATIGKMMDLQERHEANEAKKAYVAAMGVLKASLPTVIARDSVVDYGEGKSRTHYTHASLAGVMEAITKPLTDHGFDLSYRTSSDDRVVRVTCILRHTGGHSEETTLAAPPDAKGGKNGAQAAMSTVTMLQRYTALALLGIATADMKEQTGEETKAPAEGVDADRNLRAVAAVRKAGLELAEIEAELGRPAPQWTAVDREKVRDRIAAKTPKRPRENPDGSLSDDPPRT